MLTIKRSRLKRPFWMLSFRMVKSSVFKWLDHSKTDLQNVWFSNGFGIRMFGIRAPTVFGYLLYSELFSWAAKTWYSSRRVSLYPKFLLFQVNLCGNCSSVKSAKVPGYKVFTFKNPYLGNTCVPFLVNYNMYNLLCRKLFNYNQGFLKLQSGYDVTPRVL